MIPHQDSICGKFTLCLKQPVHVTCLLVRIWVQTVCKCNKQTTIADMIWTQTVCKCNNQTKIAHKELRLSKLKKHTHFLWLSLGSNHYRTGRIYETEWMFCGTVPFITMRKPIKQGRYFLVDFRYQRNANGWQSLPNHSKVILLQSHVVNYTFNIKHVPEYCTWCR